MPGRAAAFRGPFARHPDWPERLDAAIRQASHRRFAWGRHDCGLFACDAVLAMTGVDMAQAIRGKYRDARTAYGLIRRLSGGGVRAFAEWVAERFGREAVPPAAARRGDVVLVALAAGLDGEAVGICAGRHAFVAAKPAGVAPVPMAAALMAWRI